MGHQGKKILIVEDDEDISIRMANILQRSGYTVVGRVDNGESALELAAEQRPDAIIMDVNLNGLMTGLEAGQLILRQRQVAIIYITGYAASLSQLRAAGIVPLAKPFSVDDLHAALKQVLGLDLQA